MHNKPSLYGPKSWKYTFFIGYFGAFDETPAYAGLFLITLMLTNKQTLPRDNNLETCFCLQGRNTCKPLSHSEEKH